MKIKCSAYIESTEKNNQRLPNCSPYYICPYYKQDLLKFTQFQLNLHFVSCLKKSHFFQIALRSSNEVRGQADTSMNLNKSLMRTSNQSNQIILLVQSLCNYYCKNIYPSQKDKLTEITAASKTVCQDVCSIKYLTTIFYN